MTGHDDDEQRLRRLLAAEDAGDSAALARVQGAVASRTFAGDAGRTRRGPALLVAFAVAALSAAAIVAAITVRNQQGGNGVTGGAVTPSPAVTATPAPTPTATPTPTPTPTPALNAAYPSISELDMLDASNGWATSAPMSGSGPTRVLRTVDGARSWQDVTPPVSFDRLVATDATHAWAVAGSAQPFGDATVQRTVDGGRTWTTATVSQGGGGQLAAVTAEVLYLMAPRSSGAGAEGVAIYRSLDGGVSWTLVSETATQSAPGETTVGVPAQCRKDGVTFSDSQTGWVTGSCAISAGFLARTSDGGVHWTQVTLPAPPDGRTVDSYEQARFVDARDGYLLGGSSSPMRFLLYVTHDGGATWAAHSIACGTRAQMSSPVEAACVALDGTVETSHDAGATWTPVATHPELGTAKAVPATTTWFVSPTEGFFLEMQTGESHSTLYVTHDGGRTITRLGP